jgi:hypothetical protein
VTNSVITYIDTNDLTLHLEKPAGFTVLTEDVHDGLVGSFRKNILPPSSRLHVHSSSVFGSKTQIVSRIRVKTDLCEYYRII